MNNAEFEKVAKQLAVCAVTRDTKELGHIKQAAGFDLNSIGQYLNTPGGRYALGGLGGAGLGALVGAMQPKRKGRNALYYGALGGLGGLGLAHLYNSAGGGGGSSPMPAPGTPVGDNKPPAAAAPAPPAKPEAVVKVENLPPADEAARRRGQTEHRVIEVVDPVTQKTKLVHVPDVMKETAVEPYMDTPLWRKGPERVPGAEKLGPRAGTGDYETWVETGSSNMPWYKWLAGREDTYLDRFRQRLRQYYEQTGRPAQSMDDLRAAGLAPVAANAQFPNADLNDPATVRILNALRAHPGAIDRVQELGVQGAYQDMLRRQQEINSQMWENYADSVSMMP